MSSVNLLDKRHYGLTERQVLDSATKGSIFVKRNKIVVRQVPPLVKEGQDPLPFCQDPIPSRGASIYEIKQEQYDELNITDEQSATDHLDSTILVSNNTATNK